MADIYWGYWGSREIFVALPNTFLFLDHNNDPGAFMIQSLINNVSSKKEFAYTSFHFWDKTPTPDSRAALPSLDQVGMPSSVWFNICNNWIDRANFNKFVLCSSP